MGLTIDDLKEVTYIEAMKILYSTIEKKKNKKVRKATQADWDRLMVRGYLASYFSIRGEKMANIKGIMVEIGGDTSNLQNALKKVILAQLV